MRRPSSDVFNCCKALIPNSEENVLNHDPAALAQDASATDVGSLYDFDFSAIKKHDCTAPDGLMLCFEVYIFCLCTDSQRGWAYGVADTCTVAFAAVAVSLSWSSLSPAHRRGGGGGRLFFAIA